CLLPAETAGPHWNVSEECRLICDIYGSQRKHSFIRSVVPHTGSEPVLKLNPLLISSSEALHREQMLEQKLATLQRLLTTTQEASESSWQALIDEDRLLSRLEVMGSQLQAYSKAELIAVYLEIFFKLKHFDFSHVSSHVCLCLSCPSFHLQTPRSFSTHVSPLFLGGSTLFCPSVIVLLLSSIPVGGRGEARRADSAGSDGEEGAGDADRRDGGEGAGSSGSHRGSAG
ncbi:hypothetical protein XENOCAPTIV_025711, partial [Xenoophorus captivus]